MPTRTAAALYDQHPSFSLENAALRNILDRTGRSFEDWVKLTRREGPKGETERRKWLRAKHALSMMQSWWIAERAEGRGAPEQYDPEAYVEEQYAGPKAALRPIYEKLLKLGRSLGGDVKVCPCRTMVPFYRKHVFAEVKPASQERIELGLVLGDVPAKGRLRAMKGRPPSDRIRHAIDLRSVDEVDAEVERILRTAYGHGDAKRKVATGPAKIPKDLAAALAGSAKARATWATLTARMKTEWAASVEQAVKPETRVKRVATAIEKLAAGKKRMY